MSDTTTSFDSLAATPSAHPTPTPSAAKPLALLPLLDESLEQWQIHRCQITQANISQHQPMKLIYHYERLDDDLKERYPLRGNLLFRFDELMTQAGFAQLLGIPAKQVSMPWQLKFVGKLVVFLDQPEIALRLQWTNTLKPFEPVAVDDLAKAVAGAFTHWQFINHVDVISKNPQWVLTAEHPDLAEPWQLSHQSVFSPLPAAVGLTLQQYLHEKMWVQDAWLGAIKEAAFSYAQQWQAHG